MPTATIGRRVRKGEWRPEGLALATAMRLRNSSVTKAEMARVISQTVAGAPRNVEAIAAWLTEREEAGDLRVSRGL